MNKEAQDELIKGYCKTEAIEFALWLQTNRWIDGRPNEKGSFDTIEELYDKWKEETA